MSNATERLVNLALFLAQSRGPVTAEQARAEIEGYPPDQDDAAFLRMFERDKDELRAMGLCIEADAEGRYRFDASATFAAHVELSAEEAAAVQVVGRALLDDPAFPFAEELRFALAKVATAIESPDAPAIVRLADERPEDQGAAVAALDRAAAARKRAEFDYTNSRGEAKHHRIEPYGLFARDGRWYAVGRDTELDQIRVYAVARMRELTIDAARPRTPDFERPEGFDVSRFIRLPFQYGPETLSVQVRFDPAAAWRAPVLTAGAGALTEPAGDGSVTWTVEARDAKRLLRWVVENGPGLHVTAPDTLVAAMRDGLAAAIAAHAGGGGR